MRAPVAMRLVVPLLAPEIVHSLIRDRLAFLNSFNDIMQPTSNEQ